VLVDVVVRDKKGAAGALGAADFRLWEDGKERPIAGISTEETSAETPRGDYLVFLFDSSEGSAADRVAKLAAARQEVAKFAGAYASPNRYMAVVNFDDGLSIAQNLTARTERIQQAAVAAAAHSGSSSQDSVRLQSTTSAIGDASNDSGQFAGRTILKNSATGEITIVGQGGYGAYLYPLPVLDAIAALADSMAAIRGRKSLIVIGSAQSTFTGTPEQHEAARLACNRANVGLYATDAVLKDVAESTGGQLIAGDLVRGLSGIVDEQAKRYTLSFTPAESPDGSCHALRVEATRGGLETHARSSYCNQKPPDLLAGRSNEKSLEEHAAGAPAKNARIAMPYFYSAPGAAVVHLAMELDLSALKFASRNGKQHADLDVVALVYGAGGELAAKFSDTAQIDLDASEDVKAFRSRPYHYDRQIDVPFGKYNVRVAFGSGGESLGKVEAPLTIDAWDGHTLALSGIALSREARKATDLALELDPSLLEGHKPLIARSLEIAPSGDNRCRSAEPCFGYLELYDAALAGPNSRAPRLSIRVLDRQTNRELQSGDLDLSSFVRPGSSSAPVIVQVPVRALPAGAYTLEIRASSETGSAVRTVDFEVE
jgi:VWFA-related protein